MKPHLPVTLFKSLQRVLALSFTIATAGHLWASPSYESEILTIDSGYNAAVRMGDNSDTINQRNYNRHDTSSSRISAGSNDSSFSGGKRLSTGSKITTINIVGSGALYLYNSGNTDFKGTINVSNGTSGAPGVIGTYNTYAADLQIGTLTGSGHLLLRGHNTSGTSTFTVSNNTFAGTVYMTSNGGTVQVNANGKGWQDATFDFTRNKDYSDSLLDTTGTEPAKQVLYLNGDSTVAALRNGTTQYAEITGNGHTLNVGTSSGSYTYGGTITNLSGLTKDGSNSQSFSQNADIATVTVEEGTLKFAGALETTALNLNGGTLSTQQATVSTANLTGGSTWELGRDISLSTLNLTAGSGSITLSGEDVTFHAPSTISLSGYSAETGTPILTLDGTTMDLTGSTLNFEGIDLAGVSTLNFASLRNGGSYTFGDGPITVTAGGTSYEAELTTDGGMLQLAFGKNTEVAGGTKLCVNADSDGKPISGFNNANYTNGGWSGTAVKANDLQTVQLAAGSEIYLLAENTQAIYTGNIKLLDGNVPTLLHSENPNAEWELSGDLTGSGELRLVGHNTSGATIFTPTQANIDGTLSTAGARGGDIQINLSGNMQNTAVDLSAHTADSIYTPTEENTPGRAILTVEGDTTLKGINGTDSKANLTATQAGANLTLGTNETNATFSYAGTVNGDYYTGTSTTANPGRLNLTKVGNNSQHFEQNASFGSVSLQGGTLSFGGNITADELTLQGGTLSTQGNVYLTAATLYGGTTWEMAYSWNSSNTDLSFRNLAEAPVNFVSNGATWTLSQNIHLGDSGVSNYSSPLVDLNGVKLNLGSAFTLTGVQSGLTAGDTIVLANLSNGATVNSAGGEIALNNGAYKATLGTIGNQAVLTITSVTQTVAAGQNMWIHRFENENGKVTGEMEGRLGGNYTSNNWQGGTYITDQSRLSNVWLEQGAKLYLRDGAMNGATINFDRSNAEYNGDITIVNSGGDTPAQIHSEGKTWAVWNFTGQLSGSGELQLVSHGQDSDFNKWDSAFNFTNFNDEEGWFDGKVSMLSLRGGPVQLNIGRADGTDTRWKNCVIDLSNPDPTQTSIYETSSSDRAVGTVLGLVGNATIKGLMANVSGSVDHAVGVSTNITIKDQSYTLTLGTDSNEDFVYGGTLGYDRFYRGGHGTASEGGSNYLVSAAGSLNLTKIGSNTQTFTGSSTLNEITLQNGTLQFDGELTVDTLTLKGGTFINNVDISGLHTANLSSNANWLMGTDTTTNAVVFNLSGLENTGTITIDGSRGSTWTMGGDIMLENSGTTHMCPKDFF